MSICKLHCADWMGFLLMSAGLLIVLSQPASSQADSVASRWSVKQLVEFHQRHHSSVRAQDVYKLFFQAAFGVEHILTDTAGVSSYLRRELAPLDSSVSGEHLFERISLDNGVVRINLRPFKALNLNPSLLVKVMFQSAGETIPDSVMFYRMWNEFSALVRFGVLHFPMDEVNSFSAMVERGETSVVHHSREYSVANRPAYRVAQRHIFDEVFGKMK